MLNMHKQALISIWKKCSKRASQNDFIFLMLLTTLPGYLFASPILEMKEKIKTIICRQYLVFHLHWLRLHLIFCCINFLKVEFHFGDFWILWWQFEVHCLYSSYLLWSIRLTSLHTDLSMNQINVKGLWHWCWKVQ